MMESDSFLFDKLLLMVAVMGKCFHCVTGFIFLEIHGYVYEIHAENKECRYSNECNCSSYVVFIAWK